VSEGRCVSDGYQTSLLVTPLVCFSRFSSIPSGAPDDAALTDRWNPSRWSSFAFDNLNTCKLAGLFHRFLPPSLCLAEATLFFQKDRLFISLPRRLPSLYSVSLPSSCSWPSPAGYGLTPPVRECGQVECCFPSCASKFSLRNPRLAIFLWNPLVSMVLYNYEDYLSRAIPLLTEFGLTPLQNQTVPLKHDSFYTAFL